MRIVVAWAAVTLLAGLLLAAWGWEAEPRVVYLTTNGTWTEAPSGCPLYLSRNPVTDRRDSYDARCGDGYGGD